MIEADAWVTRSRPAAPCAAPFVSGWAYRGAHPTNTQLRRTHTRAALIPSRVMAGEGLGEGVADSTAWGNPDTNLRRRSNQPMSYLTRHWGVEARRIIGESLNWDAAPGSGLTTMRGNVPRHTDVTTNSA
jgi:hypothetical protein